jgi:hypothetical protein
MTRGLAILVSLAMAASASAAQGQASGHQRIGVEAESRHRVEAGLYGAWRALGADCSDEIVASLEYSWKKSLIARLSMKGMAEYSGSREPGRWSWEWGDPGATLSYLWRGDELRVQAGLGYSYPLDRRAGGGFQAFEPSLSLALVRDPVVLTAGLDARLCLPRERGGYLAWPPFSGGLRLSYWELLNDRISYRITFSPGLSLGIRRIGLDAWAPPSWSLGMEISLSWDERGWGIQAGWAGPATPGDEGGSLSLGGCCRKEW